MDLIDQPLRAELAANARPWILGQVHAHCRGGDSIGRAALLGMVDAYLRANPQDAEVRRAREGMVQEGKHSFGTSLRE